MTRGNRIVTERKNERESPTLKGDQSKLVTHANIISLDCIDSNFTIFPHVNSKNA